jgi:uncharacterized protein YdhG (YjbR/CyaY superfamily)
MYHDIDAYIEQFPGEVQAILRQLRVVIQSAAPEAQERISYGMPTFFLKKNLVHFAALKRHIGFYPTSSGIAHFKNELAPWHSGKGSVRFPIDQTLPLELIRRIVLFRVDENQGGAG